MPVWFDATQFDPSQMLPQLPVGNAMPTVITGAARQAVKDKPQEGMLVFTLQIIDGLNKGASGAYRLNLWNSNQQAAEIAHRQLSALCHVVGSYHLETDDCRELWNKPFLIDVAKQPNNPEYTQVVSVTDVRGQQPVRAAQQAAPAPTPQPQPQPVATPAQPSWNVPAGQPAPAATGAPSWSQQPQGAPAGQPSWGRG